jgi:hypothetical protein
MAFTSTLNRGDEYWRGGRGMENRRHMQHRRFRRSTRRVRPQRRPSADRPLIRRAARRAPMGRGRLLALARLSAALDRGRERSLRAAAGVDLRLWTLRRGIRHLRAVADPRDADRGSCAAGNRRLHSGPILACTDQPCVRRRPWPADPRHRFVDREAASPFPPAR